MLLDKTDDVYGWNKLSAEGFLKHRALAGLNVKVSTTFTLYAHTHCVVNRDTPGKRKDRIGFSDLTQ